MTARGTDCELVIGDRVIIAGREFRLDARRSSDPLGVGRNDGDRYILRPVDDVELPTASERIRAAREAAERGR